MAQRHVTLWYDQEADYLEIIFDSAPGYFRATASDQVMEKVDRLGNLLGLSVLQVSALRKAPLQVTL